MHFFYLCGISSAHHYVATCRAISFGLVDFNLSLTMVAVISPAGFFVCKLKKMSNTKKGAHPDGEDEEQGVDAEAEPMGIEGVDGSKAAINGHKEPKSKGKEKSGTRSKGKAKAAQPPSDSEGASDGEPEPEPQPKKKRERGIFKQAKAELLAELEAKKKAEAEAAAVKAEAKAKPKAKTAGEAKPKAKASAKEPVTASKPLKRASKKK